MTKTISAIILLFALTFSNSASAGIVNISAQPGFYDISSFLTTINNTASIDIEGTLAPHTSVVFSYALTSMGGSGITNGPATLTGEGRYNFYQNNAGNVVYAPTEGYTTTQALLLDLRCSARRRKVRIGAFTAIDLLSS